MWSGECVVREISLQESEVMLRGVCCQGDTAAGISGDVRGVCCQGDFAAGI